VTALPRPGLLGAVFLGGCVGGLARYAVTKRWPSHGFPWATLGVNLSGALLLAVVLVVLLERAGSPYLRALLGTGFCGAWTTFSGIVVSTDELVRDGRVAVAVAYLVASLLGGVAAGAAGIVTGRVVVRRRV
jgi:CrcB protein